MKITKAAKLDGIYIAEGDVIVVRLGHINNDTLTEQGLEPHTIYTGMVIAILPSGITIDASQRYASHVYTIPYSAMTSIQPYQQKEGEDECW